VKRQVYSAFIGDVRRSRPLIVVVLVIIVLLPSLAEMVTQGLPALVVLVRLTEAVAFIGAVVWAVSAVVLHYARIQARCETGEAPAVEIEA
jgi:hypothetical protein